MYATGAALRITIKDIDGLVFTFESPEHSHPLIVETDVARSVFIEKRMALLNEINRIRNSLYAIDETACGRAIYSLYKLGTTFLNEVFRDPWEIREFCAVACPRKWDDTTSPPLITMHAMIYDMLPLEVLPLLSLEAPPGLVHTAEQLAEAVHCFSGFGGNVQRIIEKIQPPACTALPHNDKLNIKLFQYGSLGGVTKLKAFLASHDRVELDGPWPTVSTQRNGFIDTLFTHLIAPSKSFEGEARDPPDAIHHFACHCDTGSPNDKHHYFRLAPDGASHEFKVTLPELYASRQRVKTALPLVFMDACESAGASASGIASFPRFFLMNGNLGFIGTEIPIRDSFAIEFARTFYSAFLAGATLGDAVHKARYRSLMRVGANSLAGLMYTVYADPDLSVFADDATFF